MINMFIKTCARKQNHMISKWATKKKQWRIPLKKNFARFFFCFLLLCLCFSVEVAFFSSLLSTCAPVSFFVHVRFFISHTKFIHSQFLLLFFCFLCDLCSSKNPLQCIFCALRVFSSSFSVRMCFYSPFNTLPWCGTLNILFEYCSVVPNMLG